MTPRLAIAETALERDHSAVAALRLIRACVDVYDNSSDESEESALSAVRSGRGAYWSNSREPGASAFRDLANIGGLSAALDFAIREARAARRWDMVSGLVASLVPLNAAAVQAVTAYFANKERMRG